MNISKKIFLIIITVLLVILPSKVFASSDGDIVVLLDPGHGGNLDSGAVSSGLRETDATWKITTKVKEILDNTPGITGILCRGENDNPTIYERGQKAKSIGADLVVSFHINSASTSIVRGSEVYVTRNTRVDRFYKNSNTLAINILNNLASIGIPKNGSNIAKLRITESNNLYPDGSLADYYGIIRYPMTYGIPSVLIEHCFITNAKDREFINNDYQISKIAEADAQAIIANKELFRFDKSSNASKAALDSISYDNNTGSIKGKVLYNEVINDMSVDTTPVVKLVSTDGTEKIEGNVSKTASFTYGYDINIMNINPYKEYFLQVGTKDLNSIPQNNVITVPIANQTLGAIYGMEINCENNKIVLNSPTYDGFLNSYPFTGLITNSQAIEGKIVVQEWINGITQAEPKVNPFVYLMAGDGSKVQCEVGYIEPCLYGFSCHERYIDKSKKYSIKVEVGTSKNISSKTEQEIQYNDGIIGKVGKYDLKIENNKLVFYYDGYMISYPFDTKVQLNGNKITGQLVVQEWINGTVQSEPVTNPKLVLKDTSGSVVAETTMKKIMPCLYSYEMNIESIITEASYVIEVIGTNPNNKSTHQEVEVIYDNQEIGKIGSDKIEIYGGKLIRGEKSKQYDGYMISYPFDTKVQLNGNKITGQLVVQEWINGTVQSEPVTSPKLAIKDTNGSVIAETTMKKVMPCLYSYEMNIANIKTGTSYVIEAIGTNPENISTHQEVGVIYNNQEIGKIGSDIIKIAQGKLIKEEKNNKYDGYMISYPFDAKVQLNGNKIKGQLVVQEWINGTVQSEPVTNPKLVLKDTNGNTVAETTMKKVMPCLYSYEIDIANIKTGTSYVIEAIGTNPENISTHQEVEVIYNNQEIGKIGSDIIKIAQGKLIKEEKNNKYDGYMISYPFDAKVQLNGNKIKGQLVVQEWINGTVQSEPVTNPKLVLKDTNGNAIAETIMKKVMPFLYSYEIDISGIKIDESYTIEVIGTNTNNISNHQVIQIEYKNQEIGSVNSYKLIIEDNKILFENKIIEEKLETVVKGKSIQIDEKQEDSIQINESQEPKETVEEKNEK